MIRWIRMFDEFGEPHQVPEHRAGRYERLGWSYSADAPAPAPAPEDVAVEPELDMPERPDEADHTHTEEYL